MFYLVLHSTVSHCNFISKPSIIFTVSKFIVKYYGILLLKDHSQTILYEFCLEIFKIFSIKKCLELSVTNNFKYYTF